MKQFIKTLPTLFLFVLSLPGISQTNKGQWLIGGSAEFNSYKYYSSKITSLTFSADGGYFFINRLAGGVRLGYDANYSRSVYKAQNTFIQVLPFIRYYLVLLNRKSTFLWMLVMVTLGESIRAVLLILKRLNGIAKSLLLKVDLFCFLIDIHHLN